MAWLSLPHTLDVYTPGVGGSGPTLVQGNLAGCFELVSPACRIQLQDVSKNVLALLWLALSAQGVVADGLLVFWRERGSWWTIRGVPQVYDTLGQEHLELTLAANTTDGFFASAAKAMSLMTTFTNASSITSVKVEVSTTPDFTNLVVNASSASSQVGWYCVSGSVWTPIPSGGLASAATQTVAYLPTGLPTGQQYFVRWTPFAGTTALTPVLGVT